MVICLERGADLHTTQLMPLPLTVSCFSKIQIGFTYPVPADPGRPGQRAVKRVCVCVCVKYYNLLQNWQGTVDRYRSGTRKRTFCANYLEVAHAASVQRRGGVVAERREAGVDGGGERGDADAAEVESGGAGDAQETGRGVGGRLGDRAPVDRQPHGHRVHEHLHLPQRRTGRGIYMRRSDVTECMVTIRSPFCGYNTT